MVRVAGFEPTAFRSQTGRANQAAPYPHVALHIQAQPAARPWRTRVQRSEPPAGFEPATR